jgi:dipeptidyl aminopeptidase/acylaminoacyl peptidase
MHRSAVPVLLALLAVLGAPAASSQSEAVGRPLAIDDYFRIRRVDDPRISHDGGRVAYTVETSDIEEDDRETAIWVMPTAGGEPVRFTAPGYSASHPRWSPDGTWLAFLAARDEGPPRAEGKGETQVWAFHRLGGDAQPLTDVKQGVESFEWSPDSSRLVMVIRDPKDTGSDEDEESGEDDEDEEKPEPWVVDRLQFKRDYRGYLDRRRTHLYVFRLGDRSLVQITSGDYDDDEPCWSPDGLLLAFTSNRTEEPDANDNTDIWIVSAESTDRGQTLRRVTTNPGADSSPAWSPDGGTLAYVTLTEPELFWYSTPHLAVVPAAGGETRILTRELDRPAYSPRFSPDGRAILFLAEDEGEQPLLSIEPSGRNPRRAVADGRSVYAFSVADDGAVALLASEPDLPDEVFLYRGRDDLERLTHTNDELLDEIRLGEVRDVEVASTDGATIETFLTLPPDYDRRLTYPAILWIHGGPVSQYDTGFDFTAHLFAAHGYVVVRPNPRGSSGYGQDFALAIWQSWGEKDYEDVMAAVDWAIGEGYADEERLGVGGWSYGGILTNYVITKTERFAGAVSGASEVLYVANYGHDHYQLEWEKELGLPWENRELWERLSPFNRIQEITTPTLVIGGEKDWNVPILNSEQLYQGLKRLGRPTKLVVYPGEHHGIRRPSFQKDRFERYLGWYDEWVKGGSGSQRDAEPH